MNSTTTTPAKLHILFFPLMAPGHMNPMVDMANLFSLHGITTTVLTTPANVPLISIHPLTKLKVIPFPTSNLGLPSGCENVTSLMSMSMSATFMEAVAMLRQPLDQVLRELCPDAIVSDSFMPWTFHAASEFGIPRLVFHGTSFFSLSASDIVDNLNPHDKDEESFTLHGFPHEIQIFKSQIPDLKKSNPALVATLKEVKELDKKSYGVLVNSFYELEPECADYYREVIGRKAWHVGPVSLCVNDQTRMNHDHYCLKWLDKKKLNSVLYVCFGSLCRPSGAQLKEIALALESANQEFIWVVRKLEEDEEEWLPEGYEKRMEDKGLIIRGWVPQVLILNHEALGGFLTHCGWNSTLEAVSAGVRMITWPMYAEQFYNEKLVADVLKIGVSVGVKEYGKGQDFAESLGIMGVVGKGGDREGSA
ncbi:UDP-glucuronosyl/UDP-glucosyltransferase protein [Dioscorea alata]|uniref:UDP-glucuronosyl/UDP-glucosyltransferase protein n=1 Tax=Dioscorea alata TaxID=55571 RepID=A0ACB7UEM4_DIOAL|nr:UDP-glucuronosyl/UDP-glucosyltransferase protein [Dioscorea alata]